MKHRLLLLNLLLIGMICFAASALRDHYQGVRAHEDAVLKPAPIMPIAPPVVPPLAGTPPVSSGAYAEVAEKMLFVRDRNPTVIVTPPPPVAPAPVRIMPPLPFAYGILDFGSGPTVILAEKSGATSKSYHVGDKIGEFQLAAVKGRELTFVWEDTKIQKRLEDLEDKAVAKAADDSAKAQALTAASPTPAAAPPAPKPEDLEPRPGPATGGESKACRSGDKSADGTVADGFRKVLQATPFGSRCYWEPVK